MAFYKFMALDRVQDLLEGFIRFTQPGAFNDPFEIPAMKLEEIEARPHDFFEAAINQTRDIQASFAANPFTVPDVAKLPAMAFWGKRSSDATSINAAERAMRIELSKEKIASIDETFGVLSLSSDDGSASALQNFLLWAHYADEHRGAALEIDIDCNEFSTDYVNRGGEERRDFVMYTNYRPLLPFDDTILMRHFFEKSPHWAYENEFRIIRNLALHDKVIGRGNSFPVYLFRLPTLCIRSITLGARVAQVARDTLISKIKSNRHLQHISIAQTHLDTQKFLLSFQSLN